MTPRFLKNQLGRSLRNMGVDCVDVFYLHNPGNATGRSSPRRIFSNVYEKRLRFWSPPSWREKFNITGWRHGTLSDRNRRRATPCRLAELVQIAQEIAGGRHRFRFVQLPFNLGMTEALTMGNQMVAGRKRTVMEAADELDVTLIASASLLQGQVASNLPGFVAEAMGLVE